LGGATAVFAWERKKCKEIMQPEEVPIRIDVGGTPFRTSMHTLMKGARLGGVDFQALCHKILGPGEPAGAAARRGEEKNQISRLYACHGAASGTE
jgi:hypothetical protein